MRAISGNVMDYTKKVFEYFSNNDAHHHIIITPHAPPVEKSSHGIEVAMENIWDDTDIRDTVLGLKNYGEETALSPGNPKTLELGLSETFCLSISGVGRFRVSYLTQRGSLSFSMKRIPFVVESCTDLHVDASLVESTLEVLCDNNGGIVAVFGPLAEANSRLVYALIKRINSRQRRIIHILERELMFLMRHDNSIIIQRELGTDCTSLNEGIRESLTMNPDIIFAGDLLVTDKIPALERAAETGTSIILSVVANDKEAFLHLLKSICGDHYAVFGRRIREVIEVRSQTDGKLSATLAAKTK